MDGVGEEMVRRKGGEGWLGSVMVSGGAGDDEEYK